MGIWGTKLYQDDVAFDVRDEYINRLKIGQSNIDATQETINANADYINDIDYSSVFWFALAETQWKYGRLLPEVKEKALESIKNQSDLLKWEEDAGLYKKRVEELQKLEEKLNSPQPPQKKVPKLVLHKATWKVGDVLLYRLKDERLKESSWYHKYVLFRVVGISKTNIGNLPREYSNEQNIVAIYNWVGEDIPKSNDTNHLEFLAGENIFGKIKDILVTFSFNNNELKKLDMKVFLEDSDYKNETEHIMSTVGTVWYNMKNIDSSLAELLENAKNNNDLIIEISNEINNETND